ncbi:MAG: hypothetical protein CL862_10120 [Cyanobium sp. NAT70]|nr:hypothetical protein [Cyanobium sp. NAT70]
MWPQSSKHCEWQPHFGKQTREEVAHPTSTIFIQIAAYRDPDLPATLQNLLSKASNPERLSFGICLQLSEQDSDLWGEMAFPAHPKLSVCRYRASESQGACWARHQAQQFYRDEDFVLQIDSHMRAIDDWDQQLLQTWQDCNDEMAVLSVYPNAFHLPCELNLATLPVMAADRFDDYGILKFQGISRYSLPEQQPKQPLPNAFIAGGFLFGPGQIVRNVPYDPGLYFYGEEIAMSARLWTHGFNLFCPNKLLLFHLYKSAAADGDTSATHWSDHSDWFRFNRKSLVRVHMLLGSLKNAPKSLNAIKDDVADLNAFWLGGERSLEDYQRWAGVNFSDQTISEDARVGCFQNLGS